MFYTNRSYVCDNLWELLFVNRHTRDSWAGWIFPRFSPLSLIIVFFLSTPNDHTHVFFRILRSQCTSRCRILSRKADHSVFTFTRTREFKNCPLDAPSDYIRRNTFFYNALGKSSAQVLLSCLEQSFIHTYDQNLVERTISLLSSLP